MKIIFNKFWDAGTSKIPRVKSNSRFDQSAGSNIQLAIKWTAKLVSLLVIVFLLTRKADWMPVLLIELAEGRQIRQ